MPTPISSDAETFISQNEVAVLSTLAEDGGLHGATIYYRYMNGNFYFVTKSQSAKTLDMLFYPKVAMTIFDSQELRTVQLQGEAVPETDITIKETVFAELIKPKEYGTDVLMPPVTQLEKGGFIAFCVTPTSAIYNDFKNVSKLLPTHRTT